MTEKREWFWLCITISLFAILITAPFIFANLTAGEEYIFGGFLFNPVDGNSYLAKMHIGWRGEWLFTLPYTATFDQPRLLFPFYIMLGLLAHAFSIPLVTFFHMARVGASIIMSLALFYYYKNIFAAKQVYWTAFLLSLFGSGLGWLAITLGIFTSDFWVAEGYPFLSSYANPHFPLAMACILALLSSAKSSGEKTARKPYNSTLLRLILSACLGFLLPFGVVIIFITLLVDEIINTIYSGSIKSKSILIRLLPISLGGVPIAIYNYIIIQQDKVLKIWNAQNVTPSPGWDDVLVSFSPLIVISLLGAWLCITRKDQKLRQMIIWLICCMILISIPWNLQRRFLLGFYIPLAGCTAYALSLLKLPPLRSMLVYVVIFLFIIPTNLIILTTGLNASYNRDPSIYLRRSEADALDWIMNNTDPDDVIMAGSDTGLYIPARTGRRVIYGHPFETAYAEEMKSLVDRFYTSGGDLTKLSEIADYIWFGPRELKSSGSFRAMDLAVAYQNEEVTLYRTHP